MNVTKYFYTSPLPLVGVGWNLPQIIITMPTCSDCQQFLSALCHKSYSPWFWRELLLWGHVFLKTCNPFCLFCCWNINLASVFIKLMCGPNDQGYIVLDLSVSAPILQFACLPQINVVAVVSSFKFCWETKLYYKWSLLGTLSQLPLASLSWLKENLNGEKC